jgi:hypothetical protein
MHALRNLAKCPATGEYDRLAVMPAKPSPKPAKPAVIAARLRAARMAKGVTQVQAAKAAGTDAAIISRFERGQFGIDKATGLPRAEPPRDMLRKLCAFYGVTIGGVLSGDAPN